MLFNETYGLDDGSKSDSCALIISKGRTFTYSSNISGYKIRLNYPHSDWPEYPSINKSVERVKCVRNFI
jgi:hypothetical protein